MAKRGRPKVIDANVRELLVGLVGMGCTRKQAARHVGVGPSTLFAALKADEVFAAQVRRAQMQHDITPLRRILEHSQTSWRAAAWILERQNPNRYARRPPQMFTQADAMEFVSSVLGLILKGACREDRARVADNLEQLLGGRDSTTPRGRRVVQHFWLVAALRAHGGPAAISGYRCPEYDRWLHDWRRHDFEMPNNTGQTKRKQRRTESLWINR